MAGDIAVSVSDDPGAVLDNRDILSEAMGPVSTTYIARRKDLAVRSRLIAGSEPRDLIGQWLAPMGFSAPIATGTDGVSAFADIDKYGRTGGIG